MNCGSNGSKFRLNLTDSSSRRPLLNKSPRFQITMQKLCHTVCIFKIYLTQLSFHNAITYCTSLQNNIKLFGIFPTQSYTIAVSCRELSLILFFSSTKGTNKFYHIDFLLNTTFYCSGFLLEYIWKKFNCSNFLLKSNMWKSYIKYNQSIFSV